MKFTVTRAANGWIVRFQSFSELSISKNEPSLFIFFELKDLVEFVESQK
jgi:hypothetical protein